MATVIDKRPQGKGNSEENRRRFIDKFKPIIKKHINKTVEEKSITDIAKIKKLKVPIKGTNIPQLTTGSSGKRWVVRTGNDKFQKGDLVNKPQNSRGNGSGNGGGDGLEDEFAFTLTKEEFLNIYFDGLSLPNFIKESVKDNKKLIRQRAGYSKYGTAARLDLKKTFEQSLARRIANRDKDTHPKFLDDEDLRYRLYVKKPLPIRKAVVFFLMDVSGSVDQNQKNMSKIFFVLLYLFLTKNYEHVDIRYIRYHHEAKEVDEKEFFYGRETGGTMVSKALELTLKTIKKDYNTETTNVYCCHSSDGDYFQEISEENAILDNLNKLLDVVSCYIYLTLAGHNALENLFKHYVDRRNLLISSAAGESDILQVFRDFFS